MAGFLDSSAGLIVPFDVVRFALAYLALVVVPGYVVVTLARPRSSRGERLVLAIPCAYALVTVYGLATNLLHIPFDVATYVVGAIPIMLVAVLFSRSPLAHARREMDRWFLVPILISLVELAIIATIYWSYAVPSGDDAVSHITYIVNIVRSHHFPLVLLNGNNSAITQGGFYPPAFHAVTALVLDLAPMPPYRAGFYSALACSSMLPLGLYVYVRAVTSNASIAGLAAVSALAFESIPFMVIPQGLYPFTAAQLFVPAFALAAIPVVRCWDRRAAALTAFLGVGLFYTHPTELLTAIVLAFTAVAPLLRNWSAWRRIGVCAMICAAVWVIAALPVMEAVHQTMAVGASKEIATRHLYAPLAHAHLRVGFQQYIGALIARNFSYVLLALTVTGAVWCLIRRCYRSFVAVQIVLSIVFVDAHTYNILGRLYALAFPWATDQRLIPTHYWFTLPLAGVGANVIVHLFQLLYRSRGRVYVGLLATPVVLVGLMTPLQVSILRDTKDYISNTVTHPSDIRALNWLANHDSAATAVVNEAALHMPYADPPMDAGKWIQALLKAQPLFNRSAAGPGSVQDRLYLLAHLSDVPISLRVATFVESHHVQYVFYGSEVHAGYHRRLRLSSLLSNPNMTLVFASTAHCHTYHDVLAARCPATASYVFLLHVHQAATTPSVSTASIAKTSYGS